MACTRARDEQKREKERARVTVNVSCVSTQLQISRVAAMQTKLTEKYEANPVQVLQTEGRRDFFFHFSMGGEVIH